MGDKHDHLRLGRGAIVTIGYQSPVSCLTSWLSSFLLSFIFLMICWKKWLLLQSSYTYVIGIIRCRIFFLYVRCIS
ncbi:hypothetical protein BDZ91DRAFT_731363 [Kalaharituber pfeilii]|nr:hypothetical protein BDZ91DRAFT_731363 [Kalaharituber pfeilii]